MKRKLSTRENFNDNDLFQRQMKAVSEALTTTAVRDPYRLVAVAAAATKNTLLRHKRQQQHDGRHRRRPTRRLHRIFATTSFFCLSTVLVILMMLPVVVFSQQQEQCVPSLLQTSSERRHVYRVGVESSTTTYDDYYEKFNATFGDYLTVTVGRRFTPPIRFEMVPLTQQLHDVSSSILSNNGQDIDVDLLYVNPFIFSCIESSSEFRSGTTIGVQSLVTQVSSRRIVGQDDDDDNNGTTTTVHAYNLTMFGGVIFTKADNKNASSTTINTISDIRNRVVACTSIVDLGSGQVQFRELQRRGGLSYIHDVKQLVFTFDEEQVVRGVLEGDFDVGFVRTDQLERTFGSAAFGNDYDISMVKVINPQTNLSTYNIDGDISPFPFVSSTRLYPEWNVAALTHKVPNNVAMEVQQALLALADHASVGNAIITCYAENECETTSENVQECKSSCEETVMQLSRCDTTVQIALAATNALTRGGYAGFRTSLSYMEIRNLQEETGVLLHNNETGRRHCVRLSDAYDAIDCPDGMLKKGKEDVVNGCSAVGLDCREGFQCFCSPCQDAFDVSIFTQQQSNDDGAECSVLDVCKTVQQRESFTFRIVDRTKRADLDLTVRILDGTDTYEIHPRPVILNQSARSTTSNSSSPSVYELTVASNHVGILLLDVLANDESIPSSPIRVEVETRDCADEFQNLRLEADEEGDCVCSVNSIAMGGKCVPTGVVLTSIVLPVVALIVFGACYVVRMKRKEADSVWLVEPSELNFDDPPKILGRGTFGLVLLAEWKGTKVAVKRVLPPPRVRKTRSMRERDQTPSVVGSCAPTTFDLEHGGTSLDSEEKSSRKPTRITRRHTLAGPFHTFTEMKSGATSEAGGEMRRKSFEGSTFKPFDFENEKRSAHLPDKDKEVAIVPLSGATRHGPEGALQPITRRGFFPVSFWRGRDNFDKKKNEFIAEMRHLSKLRHPCITTIMGAVIPRKQEPMLVLEHMEMGSLYDILHNDTLLLDGELVLPMLRDISMGMRFLHAASPPVFHGCLSSTNVLVDSKFRAKICNLVHVQQQHECTAAADIYSFGILLNEVYSPRKDPDLEGDSSDASTQVAGPSAKKRPSVPPSCPPLVATLMSDCLVSCPSDRPTFEDLDKRIRRLHVSSVEPSKIRRSWQKKKEHRKSDLLNDVFPKHVAEALREGRKVEPEERDCVTIFFSDIVGFTTISSIMPPIKVSDMLDRLYSKFDLLSHKHDVFKVETIGDAYMAATNLVKDQNDHVKRIAEFAIDALVAASETLVDENDKSKGTVKIRIGLHSGAVVANVIGSRCPRYSLFGDTVNVAARMESTSRPNRIQCSDRSDEILQRRHPDIRVASRGLTKVKGKGDIHTFWVNEEPQTIRSEETFRPEKLLNVERRRLAHSY